MAHDRRRLDEARGRAGRGIVILAVARPAYAAAALNLALSIKHHNPTLEIALLSDGTHRGCFLEPDYAVFDAVEQLAVEDYTSDEGVCPAKAKLALHRYSPYACTLYVDADSLCCGNLDPLFDQLKGSSFKSQRIRNYTQWTDPETFRAFFEVEPGQTINSSWIYFEDDAVFELASRYYQRGFPRERLSAAWSAGLPDELFLNAALERLGLDAGCEVPVMYFDFANDTRSISEVTGSHFFVTFYGNATSTRRELQAWYDAYLSALCARRGVRHRFTVGDIVANKHVSTLPGAGVAADGRAS
jgi:hypothetical protein